MIARRAELGLLDQVADTVEDSRALLQKEAPILGVKPHLERVEEMEIGAPGGPVPVRIYHPPWTATRTILWFHGGGWVVGDLDFADVSCRGLCLDTSSIVVSVDYRLAPEHPFPAGLEDAYTSLSWCAEQSAAGALPRPLMVGGESAGGNLAAALCLLAKERGGPKIDHQILIYPVTNHDFDTTSYRQYGEGYLLTRDAMIWYWDLYAADADTARDALASVLQAPDLGDLPAATLVIAGADVLRDEGEAYAARLGEAGIPVDVLRHPGQLHGFWSSLGVSDIGRAVNAEIRSCLEARGPGRTATAQ